MAVTGSVSSSTDQDWFYFDVSAAGNINVSLAIGTAADLDWFLYNASLVEVARGYSTANPEVGNYTAAAGRYYLMVSGYAGATSGYALTVNGGLANVIIPAQKDYVRKPAITTSLLQNAPNPYRLNAVIGRALGAGARAARGVRPARAPHRHAGRRRVRGRRTAWNGTAGARPAIRCRRASTYRLTAPGFRQTQDDPGPVTRT